MEFTQDSGNRRILCTVSHASIFFSTFLFSVGIPLVIYILSTDTVVKDTAKEAINFHFNVWLYTLIFGLLTWVLIGWPLLGILWLAQLVLPIVAIFKSLTNSHQVFRYPFIFRLF
ncbi:MAG: DUF4870 domain-containing protein [Nodosilinea sp.]